MSEVINKTRAAGRAARVLAAASTDEKNRALESMAEALKAREESILAANSVDLKNFEDSPRFSPAFRDRLRLNGERIDAMAAGLRTLRDLPDPVGEFVAMRRLPNGMDVGQVRVPLGVIGMIYEARPNVTVDAAGLCLKAGSAVVLRGSSEAINSNLELASILGEASEEAGLPRGCVSLIEDTSRDAAIQLMRADRYVDVLIPRGGANLIATVVQNSSVPVIETGTGNCHTYVDSAADLEMAVRIAQNAKVDRPGVCNSMETLLVHRAVAKEFLPRIAEILERDGVELRGCPETRRILPGITLADESDWRTEYLDLILAVRVVADLTEALDHIDEYSTGHSEAIVTGDYARSRRFVDGVDAAAVYVNASTRFTDGHEFGLGAEIGISTQKLHARGPMGLRELTTTKYVIMGDGHTR